MPQAVYILCFLWIGGFGAVLVMTFVGGLSEPFDELGMLG
jgi:hypothetical protein